MNILVAKHSSKTDTTKL